MSLPAPSDRYDPGNEAELRRQLEEADLKSRKRGQDVELGAERFIMRSPDGTRWQFTVGNDGRLTNTAL